MSEGELRAVTFRNVTHDYDGARALDDVSFEVGDGEFVTLLGPSGCGKTTLLRITSGFLDPTAGDVLLHGKSVVGVPPFRRNTSMVFQDYALFPHRTVAQNVAFGLRMRGMAPDEIRRRVDRMLDMLGLAGLGERRIGHISGGQAQRVALGRSMIVDPAVLLLDEPLGALDLKLRKQMQVELKRIQRQVGMTFLYVTHDQEEALAMSDRIAVMNKGRLMQYGTPHEIYRRPSSRFVADFIGEANLIPCRVAERRSDALVLKGPGASSFTAAPSGADPASGADAILVIRPENLALAEPPVPQANTIGAVVQELTFLGPSVRMTALAEGNIVLAVVIGPGGRLPAIGDRIDLKWKAEDAIVVGPG